MNKSIEQTVQFKGTSAAGLFDIFLDPKKHTEIHGGSIARITKQPGSNFSLLDGNVTGKNLLILPNRMIVQSWRGNVWKESDLDSILILSFSDVKGGAEIKLVHAFTPGQFTELWEEIYWTPIRRYLKGVTIL